ncbi:squalene/phytoene synthase family protein [Polynucleobacter sp. UK-FUSCHL-C3]|uniref:Squalene/phytoene synthase family protein n=1 Tax=Polynucleobacter sp. UK-FUSCHL-C3 TaxID=2955208 RepID=A0AAU8A2R2_9BURK
MPQSISDPPSSFNQLAHDELYQRSILESVSRTFALTIPLLPNGLEKVVGNTYLLCRIVDTIEDATCVDPTTKQELSTLFIKTVLDHSLSEQFVRECLIALINHPNHNEKDLIENIPRVLRVLQSCDERQRHAVAKCLQIMSEGMSYFHIRQNQIGLEDLQEFEKYCYVVAGVVGEMLTTLFALHSPAFAKAISGKESLAIAFGQALQMTNILKDSPEDQLRGVSWKPKGLGQTDLLVIAHQKLEDSLRYICCIPKSEPGIRQFCFLAFGLAVMTLKQIAQRQTLQGGADVKLTRGQVSRFYIFTKLAVRSDFLMGLFFRLQARALKA